MNDDLAEVEHDLVAAPARAGQLAAQRVDGREVHVAANDDDLRGPLLCTLTLKSGVAIGRS